jgi:hypothetical protein
MQKAWGIGTITCTILCGEMSKDEPLPKQAQKEERHFVKSVPTEALSVGFVYFF